MAEKMRLAGIKARFRGKNLHTKTYFGGLEKMKEQKENGSANTNTNAGSNSNPKKKPKMNKEKRFYLFTAIGCAAALAAIIIVAVVVNSLGGNSGSNQAIKPPVVDSTLPDDGDKENSGTNKPVGGLPEGMTLPVAEAALVNNHGFYYNKTLDVYHEHAGVDFSASEGAQVFAVDDGVVESIYKDDLLLGTEIVVAHADGVKSVYRFVTEAEDLKVGAEVKKGDVIATVAAATGNEYKDGAHLHFEVIKDGVSVDPTGYLTLEEK